MSHLFHSRTKARMATCFKIFTIFHILTHKKSSYLSSSLRIILKKKITQSKLIKKPKRKWRMTVQLKQEDLTKISSDTGIFQIKLKQIEAYHQPFSKLDALSAKRHFHVKHCVQFQQSYNIHQCVSLPSHIYLLFS